MQRRYLLLSLFILIFGAQTLAVVKVGDVAPDFTLVDTEGRSFTLSAKRDTVIVFMFMGYACGSCKVEAPPFEQNLHRKYREGGVQFFGLDLWDGTASIIESQFIIPTGISFPILMNASSIGFLYGMSVSNYMIIGKDGIVKFLSRHYDEAGLQSSLDTLTSIPRGAGGAVPDGFRLDQNFPNPFNPSTRIFYELKFREPTNIELVIYDILGKRVRRLVSRRQGSGFYEVEWDGRDDAGRVMPAGVYLFRLRAGSKAQTRRMLLLK